MRNRLTLMIYNEGGTYVRLKLLSKRFLRISGIVGLFFIFLFCIIVIDYAFLKYSSYHSADLKKEVRSLQADLDERNRQIENFYTKIDALQLKLIKLNQLEQEIRSYTGLHKNTSDILDYGKGGISLEDSEKISEDDFYNKFLAGMDENVQRLDREMADQSEEFQHLWETLREIKAIQQVTPSIRPVEGGIISSPFGFRDSPFSGKQEFHPGVDIAVHKGTSVVVTANGTVTFAGYKGSFGKVIFINHGFGIVTRYGHLSRIHVKKGQEVKRGDIIGEVGSTGRSTGPHLHYEVRLNDIPVNAEKYMSEYLANK